MSSNFEQPPSLNEFLQGEDETPERLKEWEQILTDYQKEYRERS